MKVLWVVGAILTGVVGVGSLLRTIERLATGGFAEFMPAQPFFGLVFLAVTFKCIQKIRQPVLKK